MKTLVHICMLLTVFTSYSQDEQPTTIYLVRHAEKEDSSSNTDLSEAGRTRAAAMVKYFEAIPIDLFYSTPYKRTQQTCSPAATAKKKEIITYSPDQMDLREVAASNPGKTILIVGHSNTIPAYINNVLGKKIYDDIPEDEYDHLYTIIIKGDSIEHMASRL
jgi:2,3-bisphosphoglycerate-dependent phosphoglycerate mutase